MAFLKDPETARGDALLLHEADPDVGSVFFEGLSFHLAHASTPLPLALRLSRNPWEFLADLSGETGHRVRFVVAGLPPPPFGSHLQRILQRALDQGLIRPDHLVVTHFNFPQIDRLNELYGGALGVVKQPCGINAVWAVLRPRLENFYASK